jgi:hypothetical protein
LGIQRDTARGDPVTLFLSTGFTGASPNSAIEFHIAALKEDGVPVPAPSSESEIVEIEAA